MHVVWSGRVQGEGPETFPLCPSMGFPLRAEPVAPKTKRYFVSERLAR